MSKFNQILSQLDDIAFMNQENQWYLKIILNSILKL